MLTETGNPVITDWVITFEVAGLPETQVKFEVAIQLTLSPLTSVLEAKVDPTPTAELFTNHW